MSLFYFFVFFASIILNWSNWPDWFGRAFVYSTEAHLFGVPALSSTRQPCASVHHILGRDCPRSAARATRVRAPPTLPTVVLHHAIDAPSQRPTGKMKTHCCHCQCYCEWIYQFEIINFKFIAIFCLSFSLRFGFALILNYKTHKVCFFFVMNLEKKS